MIRSSTIQKHSKNDVPRLLKKAENIFNEYIRLRDQNQKLGLFTCVSCHQVKAVSFMHAGHYMSAGHHNTTRFHEINVAGQCSHCNTFLHGNLAEYRKTLVSRHGEDVVAQLEIRAKMTSKLDRYTLVDIIETYTDKVKQLKAANV